MSNDELVSTNEASEILGKSIATVNRMASDGRLPVAVKASGVTGARFFRRADVEALLTEAAS